MFSESYRPNCFAERVLAKETVCRIAAVRCEILRSTRKTKWRVEKFGVVAWHQWHAEAPQEAARAFTASEKSSWKVRVSIEDGSTYTCSWRGRWPQLPLRGASSWLPSPKPLSARSSHKEEVTKGEEVMCRMQGAAEKWKKCEDYLLVDQRDASRSCS